MKKFFQNVSVLAVITGLLVPSSLFLVEPAPAQAAVSDWQQGASIVSRSATDYTSDTFKQSVRNLKATGANYVTLVFPYYQTNLTSTTIFSGSDTPSDATLASAVQFIHGEGMKVMLKPHLEAQSGQWRGTINPSNRTAWFASYGALLNRLATLAEQSNVEAFCLGAELVHMTSYVKNSSNTQNWIKMIQGVRQRYSGFVTYSGNWGGGQYTEAQDIRFWTYLDAIGISGYFPLATDKQTPTVEEIMASWQTHYNNMVKPLSDANGGKKVMFT